MSRAFRTSRPLLVHVLGFPEGDANTTPSVVHVASPSGKKMSATVVHVRATEGMRVRATRPLLVPEGETNLRFVRKKVRPVRTYVQPKETTGATCTGAQSRTKIFDKP